MEEDRTWNVRLFRKDNKSVFGISVGGRIKSSVNWRLVGSVEKERWKYCIDLNWVTVVGTTRMESDTVTKSDKFDDVM